MAFTEAQRVQIRLFLGYPDVFQDANTRLESAIDVIGGRADTQTQVESILTQLAAADSRVNNVLGFSGIKRVEDVEFFEGGKSMLDARKHGRMHANRLSIMFGVPLANDVFGMSGYGNDGWMYGHTSAFPLG